MGQIVGAFATVHAPQLFTRPPSEVPEQLDADLNAMRLMGKELDELKPDAVIVIGSDHLETFFLSSVATFAVIAGETSRAHFATKSYNMKVHLPLADDILDKVGNTKMLPWYIMFGATGNIPGELITYQPTWHHGHAVMRFLPNKRKGRPIGDVPPAYNFTQGGFEFY